MFDFKFDWCKEMECGVPAIDDQHQILFHIGREMEQLIMHQIKDHLQDFLFNHVMVEDQALGRYLVSSMKE